VNCNVHHPLRWIAPDVGEETQLVEYARCALVVRYRESVKKSETRLLSNGGQMVQHCCTDALVLKGIRNDEGNFGFIGPGDPISSAGDNRHSEVMSDKPDKGNLTDKIAIHERRHFYVGQVMLRLKEPIGE
jgi:hypothetical protein